MTTEIAPVIDNSQDTFALMARSSSKFLPRLQLFGGKSGAVVDGVIPVRHWGRVAGDDITDLGENVDVHVLQWRPKAMELGDSIKVVFDVKDPEFARIQNLAAVEDSGCMAGPEFLVYCPQIKEFLTYFATGGNAREDAKKLVPLIGKTANLSSRVREQGKYKNVVPVTKVASDAIGDLPAPEEVEKQVKNFLSPPPPEKTPQQAAADAAAAGERPR